MFIILSIILQPQISDTILIFEFVSQNISREEMNLISSGFINEISKKLPTKKIEKAKNFLDAKEICKKLNFNSFIFGVVDKEKNKYMIQTIYFDILKSKADTVNVVTTSPLTICSSLAEYIKNRVLNQEESEFGSIYFETTPPGAEILLNGEFVGITPKKIDLIKLGDHSVLLSKKGYAITVKLIVVYPGRTTNIFLNLVPIEGAFIAPEEDIPVYVIDEVIVRGKKIREELFILPKGVEIITSRDIEFSGAKTIPEVLSQLSGITIKDPTGSGVHTVVSIRGMDPSKYTIVTVDGIIINTPDGRVNWNMIPIDIVKRIEIIKGPVPSHYGSGAIGGVINIITKEEERNKISLAGTFLPPTVSDRIVIDGNFGLTYSISNSWNLWVNTTGRLGKGWRKHEDYDIRSFYLKTEFPIEIDKVFSFSIDANTNKASFPGGISLEEIRSDPTTPGIDKEKRSWKSIRLGSYYEFKKSDTKFSIKFHTMPEGHNIKDLRSNGIMMGLSTLYERGKFLFCNDIVYSGLSRKGSIDGSSIMDNSGEMKINSLFQWKVEPIQNIIVTPGIKNEFVFYRVEDNTKFPFKRRDTMSYFLAPKIGIIFPTTNFDIYCSYDKTIKTAKSYEKVKNMALKPEEAANLEIGTRMRYHRISSDLSYFLINVRNQIIARGADFYNLKEHIYHRGIEGDINIRIIGNISLYSEWTLIDARFKNSKKYIPLVPNKEYSLGIKLIEMPIYSLNIRYHRIGRTYIDEKNEYFVDEYSKIDVSTVIKPTPGSSIIISITNVGNERGASFGYLYKNTPLYYPIPPQGVKLKYVFEF